MSALSSAVRDIAADLPDEISKLPKFLQDLSINTILPAAVILCAVGGFLRVLSICIKLLFPPGAPELHKQALGCLKDGEDKEERDKAIELLEMSLRLDPLYLPSYLTLTAVYIYQDEDATSALKTLDKGLQRFPKNKDLLQLQLDAKAVQQNLQHMVRAGFFSSKYLGEAGYLRKRR